MSALLTIPFRLELRRGLRADLPATSDLIGEPFFCEDTGELFVWNGTAMVEIGDAEHAYIDAQDAATLAAAHTYTDDETARAESVESALAVSVATKASSTYVDLQDAATLAAAEAYTDAHVPTGVELLAHKDQPNGYPSLDGGGHVPLSELPASIQGAMQYEGVWDASANSPALASGVGTKGFFYKVSVAGNTSLDGNSNWHIGDLAIFDGSVWDKVDNYEAVTSVAGRTGAVTLAESDIASLTTDLATLSSAISSEASTRAAADALAEVLTHKDVANGYAGLDAGGKLKDSELPTDAAGTMALSELDVITLKIDAANKDIILSRSAAASLAVTGSPSFLGSIQTRQLANLASPTVVPTPNTGATQLSYTVVANDAVGGSTKAPTPTLISNGPDTLDGSHFVTIGWTGTPGAVSYSVYRGKVSGTSPTTWGKIGTVAADAPLSFVDTGIVADSSNYPQANTTGNSSEPGVTSQAGLAYFWGGYGPVMPIVAGANAALGNANKVCLALFYLPFPMLMNKLTVFVGAVSASASQQADFGIADINMNLLCHATINVSAGQATGARQGTIFGSVTLQPGFYWFSYTTNSTDATFALTVAVANANTIMNKTNNPARNGTGNTTSGGALPTHWVGASIGGIVNYTITAAALTLPYCLFE